MAGFEVIIKKNANELAIVGAEWFLGAAQTSASKRGRFSVAVSGGSTPRVMHRNLAQEPFFSQMPWNETHIFYVDERCVPVDDPASNFGDLKKDLLERAPQPIEHIHPMPGETTPADGANAYERELKAYFQQEAGFPVFDLIFLGIGKDGHTASLFTGQEALEEKEKWIVSVKGGNPDVYRLTMTLPVINHARHVVFLVSGEGKAEVLKSLFEESTMPLPAQRIKPVKGQLTWLLDRAAASRLPIDGSLLRR